MRCRAMKGDAAGRVKSSGLGREVGWMRTKKRKTVEVGGGGVGGEGRRWWLRRGIPRPQLHMEPTECRTHLWKISLCP